MHLGENWYKHKETSQRFELICSFIQDYWYKVGIISTAKAKQEQYFLLIQIAG